MHLAVHLRSSCACMQRVGKPTAQQLGSGPRRPQVRPKGWLLKACNKSQTFLILRFEGMSLLALLALMIKMFDCFVCQCSQSSSGPLTRTLPSSCLQHSANEKCIRIWKEGTGKAFVCFGMATDQMTGTGQNCDGPEDLLSLVLRRSPAPCDVGRDDTSQV